MKKDTYILDEYLQRKTNEAQFEATEEHWLHALAALEGNDEKPRGGAWWRYALGLLAIVVTSTVVYFASQKNEKTTATTTAASNQAQLPSTQPVSTPIENAVASNTNASNTVSNTTTAPSNTQTTENKLPSASTSSVASSKPLAKNKIAKTISSAAQTNKNSSSTTDANTENNAAQKSSNASQPSVENAISNNNDNAAQQSITKTTKGNKLIAAVKSVVEKVKSKKTKTAEPAYGKGEETFAPSKEINANVKKAKQTKAAKNIAPTNEAHNENIASNKSTAEQNEIMPTQKIAKNNKSNNNKAAQSNNQSKNASKTDNAANSSEPTFAKQNTTTTRNAAPTTTSANNNAGDTILTYQEIVKRNPRYLGPDNLKYKPKGGDIVRTVTVIKHTDLANTNEPVVSTPAQVQPIAQPPSSTASTASSKPAKPKKVYTKSSKSAAATVQASAVGKPGSTSPAIAPMLGVAYRLPLSPRINIQLGMGASYIPQLNYSYRAVVYNYAFGVDSSVFQVQHKTLLQLCAPLQLQYKLGYKSFCTVGFGANIGLDVLSNVTPFGSTTSTKQWGYRDGYNVMQPFAQLGYQYMLNSKLAISASYWYGLTDITQQAFFTNSNVDRASRCNVGLTYYWR